ncbi:hypothetical protein PAXRUDRAFT_649083 [Paxillus rubicundulus Ve08.2h10]|uniref:Unplaced genomic scaffold scaffold_607, whole genome shotgun sequence n=1 Tax=Paxillus rubicundulus Ve08.2h10 TaxID=930991 RepID=A0A0D0E2M3_9AGAM|nr:hypothetical protein PAXRUDRAFT_649083 [Paxillus rubicundulus Ve08.2h10]
MISALPVLLIQLLHTIYPFSFFSPGNLYLSNRVTFDPAQIYLHVNTLGVSPLLHARPRSRLFRRHFSTSVIHGTLQPVPICGAHNLQVCLHLGLFFLASWLPTGLVPTCQWKVNRRFCSGG